MNSFLLKISICLAMVVSFLAVGYAQATDYGYITLTPNSDKRKTPMAVPYFVDKAAPGQPANAGRNMASLLTDALVFHGFISVVPPENYGGKQDADWQKLGVEYAILGQYESTPNGVALEMRLIDTKDKQVSLGKRYQGVLEKRDRMVLKYCDDVIEHLSGERGVSLTQVTFIADTSGSKEVYVADVLGRNIRQVTRHKDLTAAPKFTRDGNSIAYTSYHRGGQTLYLTQLSKTTTRAISWREGLNMAPNWTPDGQSMAVTLSMGENSDIYLTTPNAREGEQVSIIRRLTKDVGANISPSFSPDGRRIAFTSDRGGTPQIYIMDINSLSTTRLTFYGEENTKPSWSPKDKLIAYTGRHEGGYHIFVIPPDGGTPQKITNSNGSNESPSWAPDGRNIVYQRKKSGGVYQLAAVLFDGSEARELFSMKGSQQSPDWGPRMEP